MNWFQRLFSKAASSLAKFMFQPTWTRYAFTKYSTSKLISDGYKANAAVSACATTLQLTFPEPPLLAGIEEDGRFIPDYRHEIMRLLRKPNPDMGMAEFMQFVIAYAPISGNTYIWKQRSANGKVVALWPFSDLQITPIAGHSTSEGLVAYYEYDAGDGAKIAIAKEDVIHWKWMIDPQNPWKGIGAIELSAREVDRDTEATSYIFALLKNNAVPPVVITLEEGDDPTQDEKDVMALKWVQKHSSGQPAFITHGMKAEQMGYDLHKLAAETLADVPETRIAANFHVPPSVAGLNVGVKRSDYGDTAARKAYTEQTLMALWRSLASEMLNGLKDDYRVTDNFVLQFDVRNVGALQEQAKDKWLRITDAWNRSLLTRAEAKQELGMKPGKGDDVYFVSLASEFVPAGTAVIRTPAEPVIRDPSSVNSEQPQDETQDMPGGKQKKSVTGGRMLQRIRTDVAKRMESAVDVYFSQLSDRVTERVGKSKKTLPSAGDLITSDDRKKLEALIKRFFIEIIQLSWGTWNYSLGVELAFDLTDPAVTRALKLAGQHVQEIQSTLLEAMRAALTYGNENGWSIDQLVRGDEAQRGLRDIIDETYKNQARAIARSELGQAQNMASVERYRGAGLEKVEILDGGSDDSAPACQLANGQIWTVDLLEANLLQHPNCTRCPAPYFGDDEPVTSWPYPFGERG